MSNIKFTAEAKKDFVAMLRNGMRRRDAIDAIGISRWTLREHLDNDRDFADEVEEAELEAVELVEDALFKKATSGNITAQIFYLCNRNPKRWASINKLQVDGKLDVSKGEIEAAFERILELAVGFVDEERRGEFYSRLASITGPAAGNNELPAQEETTIVDGVYSEDAD